MKAYDYIGYIKQCRKQLIDIYYNNGYPCEPLMTYVWIERSTGSELIPVLIHQKDKNKNTLKSLKYEFREL